MVLPVVKIPELEGLLQDGVCHPFKALALEKSCPLGARRLGSPLSCRSQAWIQLEPREKASYMGYARKPLSSLPIGKIIRRYL